MWGCALPPQTGEDIAILPASWQHLCVSSGEPWFSQGLGWVGDASPGSSPRLCLRTGSGAVLGLSGCWGHLLWLCPRNLSGCAWGWQLGFMQLCGVLMANPLCLQRTACEGTLPMCK